MYMCIYVFTHIYEYIHVQNALKGRDQDVLDMQLRVACADGQIHAVGEDMLFFLCTYIHM
jgi:tellurite resistance protein